MERILGELGYPVCAVVLVIVVAETRYGVYDIDLQRR